MDNRLDFPLHGSSLNIVRKHGAALCDILDTKFGCVATFDGVDFESESRIAQQHPPPVAPEKRFSISLCGVQVSVWKADLTRFHAHAVVNAANCFLDHAGGLAKALSEVGGPQIQQESDDYIKMHGSLHTGDAVALGAGSLPCRKIIHAVGPHVSRHPSKKEVAHAKDDLKKVIYNIFNRVEEHCLSTVAIPAISSGLFNYPLPDCADTIVETVKTYCEHTPYGTKLPKEIFLVNNDEPTVREMERACHQIFSSGTPKLYSQATAGKTRASADTSALTLLQVGQVLLTLKKDKIEEQKTDVIVNTASSDGNLTIGQVSKAILDKAGYEMQQEIMSAKQNSKIIATRGYKLNCKEVYHTFCIRKNSTQEAQQVLYSSVQECLCTAGTKRHKSIAFPAIGTGNLGFSKPEVAQIMLRAVVDFAQTFTGTLNVNFVIFPPDKSTFEAFEEQIRSYKQHMSHSSFKPGPEDKREFHSNGATAPQISLSCPSKESAKEAEKWLQELFKSSSCVKISNNFIQHLGKKEYQRLSGLSNTGVSIEEFLTQGHACMEVEGNSKEDIVNAVLQVEKMLCDIQKEFVSEEEKELRQYSSTDASCKRWEVSSQEFSDRSSAFKSHSLRVLKVEKVENPALKVVFELKKKHLSGSSRPETMFQRVPAEFCEMIYRIGFHAEGAPPEDPLYGEGIYFAHTIKKAMELWKEKKGKYLYFVEADVLTGTSTSGKRGLILPPHMGTDPHVRFDSVSGGSDVSVIFSGYQALPKYIITCEKYVKQ